MRRRNGFVAVCAELRGDELAVGAVDAIPTAVGRAKDGNIRFAVAVIIGGGRGIAVCAELNSGKRIVGAVEAIPSAV